MRKILRDLIILLVIVGITLWLMLKDGQTAKLPVIIMNTNIIWVLLGIGCMTGVLLIDGLLIKELARIVKVKTSLSTSIRYAMIGQYFNLVTPLSAGSQPAMILAMTLKGSFSTAQSTSLIIGKYVIYQITITLYSILLLIITFHTIADNAHYAIWYALIGIVLHLLTILFMYLVTRNADTVNRVVVFISVILRRIGFRNMDHTKVSNYAHNLALHINELGQNKEVIFKASMLTFIQITLYFSIGYFLYLGFNLHEYSYIEIMAVQALLYMAVSFVPTPGNAGASEGAIYFLFGMFFPDSIIIAYVLLWRFIVFYLSLLVSGCFTLYDHIFIKPLK